MRVACPQGIWARGRATARAGCARTSRCTSWPAASGRRRARRGDGAAARACSARRRRGAQALDRHLPEIAALIDPRQFELITARDAGVVVIQGGAGSGKTTVGLHRLAYLAYAYPRPVSRRAACWWSPTASALAAYIGEVLPSLGVEGVRVVTFASWAERELRARHPLAARHVVDEALPAVTRVKSHPALLHELERRARGATPGKRDLARGGRAVGRPAHRSRAPAGAAARRRRDADLPSATSSRRTGSWSIGWRPSWRAIRASARPSRGPGRKKSAARDAADAARHALDVAMGLEQKPGQRTVDSDLPEGMRRVEGERATTTTTRTSAATTGIDGLRTEDDRPLLDLRRRGDPAARAPAAARRASSRSRTCSSTRRRICRP